MLSSESSVNHSSNIKDYWSQIMIANTNEKISNIVKITKMWHRDTMWANAVRKMTNLDLTQQQFT